MPGLRHVGPLKVKVLFNWRDVLRADPCCWCGNPSDTVDHVFTRSYGAYRENKHGIGTLVGACHECNNARGGRSVLIFLYVRGCAFMWKRPGPRISKPNRPGRRNLLGRVA